jgi:hypothetical protein
MLGHRLPSSKWVYAQFTELQHLPPLHATVKQHNSPSSYFQNSIKYQCHKIQNLHYSNMLLHKCVRSLLLLLPQRRRVCS